MADDDRAVGGDQRHPHELADGPEERAALVLHGGELVAVAVPDGGPDRLRLGDLGAQRRRAVHAGEPLQQTALVDDGDGDVEARLERVILGGGDERLGLIEREWHGRKPAMREGPADRRGPH